MTLPVGKIDRLEPVAVPGCRVCAGRHVAREVARQRGAMGLVRSYNRQIAQHPHHDPERPPGGPRGIWEQ